MYKSAFISLIYTAPNMRSRIPGNTRQVIKHIGTGKVNVTTILDILCMPDGANTFQAIQRKFGKLCLLISPDCVRWVDENAGPGYVQVLSRSV